MTDISEAELFAVEQACPEAKAFLSDFHREQAWERWVKDHKHGLSNEKGTTSPVTQGAQDDSTKELLVHLPRNCFSKCTRHAPPSDEASGAPQDALYQKAVKNLHQSEQQTQLINS